MALQQLEIDEEITASALLKQEFGKDSELFFLSVNGEMASESLVLKTTDKILAIPKVSGG